MPYITQERRDAMTATQDRHMPDTPKNAGELNYAFTMLAIKYFTENGGRYAQINDVLGALEGAKLEFYRRLAGPYEDGAIQRNGDCYP